MLPFSFFDIPVHLELRKFGFESWIFLPLSQSISVRFTLVLLSGGLASLLLVSLVSWTFSHVQRSLWLVLLLLLRFVLVGSGGDLDFVFFPLSSDYLLICLNR